jgi:phospholipid N-methyltransferase
MQSRQPKKSHRVVLSKILLFVRNFLKYPAMQGSLIPSSHFLVNGMLRQVDWEKARVLVEFGPGVGTMTQEILRRMHPDATLVTIELNAEFVHFLQNEIRDQRLRVVHGSAAEVLRILRDLNFSRADYIISSLPYTNMGDAIRREIMQESRRVLTAEGSLLFFQYTTAILPSLRSSFSSVRQEFELLNFPPALIFNCTP